MKKRTILIIVLLILLVLKVSSAARVSSTTAEKIRAYGTETVEQQFYQGERIQIQNEGTIKVFTQLLKFSIVGNGTKVYVRDMNSNQFMSLIVGECDLLNFTRVCFDSGSRAGQSLNARIFVLVPDMEMTQYISKAEASVGETNTLRIEIYNDGILDSVDTIYEEILPPEIEVTDVDGASVVEGNKVYWKGTIEGKDTKTIEYDFRALEAVSYNTTANLTYNNYLQTIELTAKADIITKAQIKIDEHQYPEKIYLGNKALFSWNLTNVNEDEENVTVSELWLTIPQDLQITGIPMRVLGYNIDKEQYLWAGRIVFNQSRDFWLEFIPKTSGVIEIPMIIKYIDESNNETYPIRKEFMIDVLPRDVQVWTGRNLSLSINASSKYPLQVTLRNVDTEVDYADVKLKVYNDYFSEEILVGNLERSSAKTVNVTLSTPSTVKRTQMPLFMEVEYLTSFGTKEKTLIEKTLSIVPFKEIEIRHEFEKGNISGGDLVDVNVFIKSNSPHRIKNITLKETIPGEVFIKGPNSASVNFLEGYEEYKIISYTLNIPSLKENKTLNLSLKSTLDYQVDNTERKIEKTSWLEILPGERTLLESLMEQASVTGSAVRSFTSLPFIGLFVISLLLLAGSVATVYNYKREFGIPGIDAIQTKEKWIRKKKQDLEKQEAGIRKQQAKIDTKILILKDFLDKTSNEMKERLPASEERVTQLDKRKDDMMRQKKEIDSKIKELQEEEYKLMAKYNALEAEKNTVIAEETKLYNRHEKMKSRLIELKNNFESLLNKEGKLEVVKNKLNEEEIKLMKNKEKLLESGSVKIVSEKEDIVNEKIELEHEKNRIEEEITALRSKKDDIINEQETLEKQKVELKNEMNVFDGDRATVEKSLKFLQSENDKLKKLLTDMKEEKKEDK